MHVFDLKHGDQVSFLTTSVPHALVFCPGLPKSNEWSIARPMHNLMTYSGGYLSINPAVLEQGHTENMQDTCSWGLDSVLQTSYWNLNMLYRKPG